MKNIIAIQAPVTSPLATNKIYYPISLTEGSSTFKITNGGTAAAPCRLSLTPINDALSIIVSGLSDESFRLTNIYRGDRIVVDGINNTIQVNGNDAFDRFDGWEFPRLLPGENEITITGANDMNLIEIEFQPRYM